MEGRMDGRKDGRTVKLIASVGRNEYSLGVFVNMAKAFDTFHQSFHLILYYKAKSLCICLFVCLFSLSGKQLTNRLT